MPQTVGRDTNLSLETSFVSSIVTFHFTQQLVWKASERRNQINFLCPANAYSLEHTSKTSLFIDVLVFTWSFLKDSKLIPSKSSTGCSNPLQYLFEACWNLLPKTCHNIQDAEHSLQPVLTGKQVPAARFLHHQVKWQRSGAHEGCNALRSGTREEIC